MSIAANIDHLRAEIGADTTLVAVSKYSSTEAVREAYAAGQRDFGENKAQDLALRQTQLPADIRWHFIGHLQSNKVKYIAPFVHLVLSVDSLKLLEEIEKQAAKNSRIIPCLLQVHIATEETKYGLDEGELTALLNHPTLAQMPHVIIKGLMGMATNTPDESTVMREFESLRKLYIRIGQMNDLPANVKMEILSMGMSGDYHLALKAGSNMIRIGSALFA
jgi:pyridoxal phosphate enzyme (YggS family)